MLSPYSYNAGDKFRDIPILYKSLQYVEDFRVFRNGVGAVGLCIKRKVRR